MPTLFWNAGEKEVIKGLDILGYRKCDQDVEKAWVSGVTTISQRARYLSLLPWLLMEYYRLCGIDTGKARPPKLDEFRKIQRRLELVVLAATRSTDQALDRKTGGLLGSDIYIEEARELARGGSVQLDLDRGGATFGTYVVPCRMIGLIGHESVEAEWEAPKITPRGQRLYEVRRRLLGHSALTERILGGGLVEAKDIAAEASLFSAGALDQTESGEERRMLEQAFFEREDGQDPVTYDRFLKTVRFVLTSVQSGCANSESAIAARYVAVTETEAQLDAVSLHWAAYEMHRRVHFALELLLEALTSAIVEVDGATVEDVMVQWKQETDLPPILHDRFMPAFELEWNAPYSKFLNSIPAETFVDNPVDRSGRRLPAARDKAVYAMAYLSATWRRSRSMFKIDGFPRARSGAERVFPILAEASDLSLEHALTKLIDHGVVEAHLNTTLKKMGQGLKCSLRFFPDGRVLRPTGVPVAAGFSGDRLGNVMGILTDLGLIAVDGENSILTAGGHAWLDRLGGLDHA